MNYDIYNWNFVFNPYTKKWMAARRENSDDLYSNIDSEKILKSSSIDTLLILIDRTGGDAKKIEELLANQKVGIDKERLERVKTTPFRHEAKSIKPNILFGQTKVV